MNAIINHDIRINGAKIKYIDKDASALSLSQIKSKKELIISSINLIISFQWNIKILHYLQYLIA